ncbi:DNA-binding response regulator [Chromatiales bacterium (ex Bugula neritina AB1)]|nr:DNA-binding response regulator [Chromatiales bacterium (ex Bugula neritina AB1)]
MTKSTHTVLLVDDDESLNRLVQQYLESQGFTVSTAMDGHTAVNRIIEENPDLVILDVMLPGTDGLSVCREVRPNYEGPILMLTALGEDIDEVAGLETGADDYLAKPVRPRVLLARVRALLRRHSTAGSSEEPPAAPDRRISIGNFAISQTDRTATQHGELISLTDAEFELLWLLASHAGQILSRDDINRALRGLEHDGTDRTIDLRISRLRKKLNDDSKEPRLIKSIRGKGYLFSL